MTREQESQQVYIGYLASIMLALVLATIVAGAFAPVLSTGSGGLTQEGLMSALFFAACFANPAGLVLRKRSVSSLLFRMPIGFGFGLAVNAMLIQPYVGDMMSRYTLILIASVGMPIMMLRDAFDAYLRKSESSFDEFCARVSLHILHWPDRFLFVALMALVFVLFMVFAKTIEQTLIGLAATLAVMTVLVAIRSARDQSGARSETTEFEAWLALIPDPDQPEENELMVEFRNELKRFGYAFAPGAAFFGGLMWLASFLVREAHPLVQQHLGQGTERIEVTLLVAVTGLGIVFFGAIISGLMGIGLLHVIGHYARWPKARIRSASFRIMRALSFRPMTRSS